MTSIGECAFQYCSNLSSFTIPNSLAFIGYWAFDNTAWYNNQPDGLIYIGMFAYKYKGTMPDNTSIVIKDGTIGIVDGAFEDCKGLISITIPNGVTYIGSSAFDDCHGLTSVKIPNSVTDIGSYAFQQCYALTSITIPNGVTKIQRYSFSWCIALTSVTIPNSVTKISSFAFSDCRSLTSITIPDNVTSIGIGAFEDCSSLTSIVIPRSVTSIEICAFSGNENVKEVFSLIEDPFEIERGSFSPFYGYIQDAILYVPVGTLRKYESTQGWRDFNKIIEFDPTDIKRNVFDTK